MTRIYLHIGLQKTGTSYLQNVCWNSSEELRGQGVTLVPAGRHQTFWLALDVRGRLTPKDGPRVARSLAMLPGQLAAVDTPAALITQETLGSAAPKQIRRLLDACAPHEVHVVLTVRDIARQIPSLWQEGLKAGRSYTLQEYVASLREAGKRTNVNWRRLDLPGVLRRWAEHVPAERIHVITVPPPGGPRELLLERFCSVLGVQPDALDVAKGGAGNKGLGVEQAEVLRRVNEQLPDEYRTRIPYGDVGKRYFAMGVLARQTGTRITLAREHEAWCREIADESVAAIHDLGCHVVGDVSELVPDTSVYGDQVPPSEAELLGAATSAISAMLEERLARRLEERERSDVLAPVNGLGARLALIRSRARAAVGRRA